MAKTVFIYSQEEHVSFTGDEFRSAKWKPFVFRSQSSAQCCSRSDQCWRPHWRNSQHCAQEPGAAVLTHRSSSAEGLPFFFPSLLPALFPFSIPPIPSLSSVFSSAAFLSENTHWVLCIVV